MSTSGSSSQHRSRSNDRKYHDHHPYPSFEEDDSSSPYVPSSLEDDELVLSALARMEEREHIRSRSFYRPNYRPKTRGASVINYDTPQYFQTSQPQTMKRKSVKRKKTKKRKKKTTTSAKTRKAHPNDTIPTPTKTKTTTPELSNVVMQPSSSNVPSTNKCLPREQDNKRWHTTLETTRQDDRLSNLPPDSIKFTSTTSTTTYDVPPKPILARQQLSPATIQGSPNTSSNKVPVQPKQATISPTTPWVRRYLNARPKDVLLPVPKEYIADAFNLAQLAPIVERIGFQVMGPQAVDVAKRLVELPPPQPSYPIYRLALQLLLNEDEQEEANILRHPLIPPEAIQQASEALYLMIHARFVISPRGLDALRRILLNSPVFGKCPRIQCDGTMLLPYGTSNDYTSNNHSCQRFCPRCGNIWNCWDSKTDGCAWGPSLCYLLLMAHGHELFPESSRRRQPSSPIISTTELHHPSNPAVFGFRIHPAATWGRPLSS